MRRQVFIVLATILTSILLLSCNDENWTPNPIKKQKKPFDVEDARKFLKQSSTNEFVLPDFSNKTMATRSGKTYDWKSARPQWKRSRIIEGEDYYALQTALEDGIRHSAKLTITENGKTHEQVNRWFSRLVIYKQKHTGHTTAMIFSIVPEIEWFKKNKSSISHLNFNDLKDFTGIIIYSTPDGTTMTANQYIDGQRSRVRLLKPQQTPRKSVAQDTTPKVHQSMKKTIHLCLHGVMPTLLTRYSDFECHSDSYTGYCSGCGSNILGEFEVPACDTCREEEANCQCCNFCENYPCECCRYCGESNGHYSDCPLVNPGSSGGGTGGLDPGSGGGGGGTLLLKIKSNDPETDCDSDSGTNPADNKAQAQTNIDNLLDSQEQTVSQTEEGSGSEEELELKSYNDFENLIANNNNTKEVGAILLQNDNKYSLGNLKQGEETRVTINYTTDPGMNLIATVHSHPSGEEKSPSIADIMGVAQITAETGAQYQNFQGGIINYDGGYYQIYVEDRQKAVNFYNNTINHYSPSHGIFYQKTPPYDNLYDSYIACTDLKNSYNTQDYVIAAFLKKSDSGLKLLHKKKKDTGPEDETPMDHPYEQFNAKQKPGYEYITPTICP